jgi:Periplasmic copper-binding protein (NosD)
LKGGTAVKNDLVHSKNRARSSVLRGATILIGATMWLFSATAWAANISVDCSNPKAKVKTISDALTKLNKTDENTIHVSGTCSEWVTISHFENLTLIADGSASISAPSTPSPDGTDYVISAYDSGTVSMNGLTINGGEVGVLCARVRFCYLVNSTIQGASEGVGATSNTNLYLEDDTIQNNPEVGVSVSREVSATLIGSTIQQNGIGIQAGDGSMLTLYVGTTGAVTVQDNTNAGVIATNNSTLRMGLGAASIRYNGGAAVYLWGGSVAQIGSGNEITGGTYNAVEIGDLSLVTFSPGSTVSGSSPAVNCGGKYSVANGLENYPGISTNCQ